MEHNKPDAWSILNKLSNVLSVITAFAVVFMAVQFHGLNTSLVNFMNDVGGDLVNTENPVNGTELSGVELSETLNNLGVQLETLRTSNVYIPVTEGDYTFVSLYNTEGESIVDAESKIVYLNNGDVYTFSDQVYYGSDIDMLTTLGLAVETAKNGNATVQSVDFSTVEVNLTEYLIDVHGYDNIQRMYGLVSEELAEDFVTSLQENFKNSDALSGVDTENINIRYALFSDGTAVVAAGTYYYFGDKSVGNDWGNCYSSWLFEGYNEIGEWSFSDDWYSIDTETIETEETQEKLIDLMKVFYADTGKVLEEAGIVDSSTGETLEGIEDLPNLNETDPTLDNDDSDGVIGDTVEVDVGSGETADNTDANTDESTDNSGATE